MVRLGPLIVEEGTLTAEDRAAILQETGCSVSVRGRTQWGSRGLTVCGPPSRLVAAKRMAEEAIAASVPGKAAPAKAAPPKAKGHGAKGCQGGKGGGIAPAVPKAAAKAVPFAAAAAAPPPAPAHGGGGCCRQLQYQLGLALVRIATLENSVCQLQQMQAFSAQQGVLTQQRLHTLEHPPRARSRSPPRSLHLEEVRGRGRAEEEESESSSDSAAQASSQPAKDSFLSPTPYLYII